MADYNQSINLLEAGASGVTVNGSTPATISFAGTSADDVRSYRVGERVPIYQTLTRDNPAWERHRQTTIAKGDEWIACLDLYGRTDSGYSRCESIYDAWQALLDSFPPRTITAPVIVGYRQAGAVNNRVVSQVGATSVFAAASGHGYAGRRVAPWYGVDGDNAGRHERTLDAALLCGA